MNSKQLQYAVVLARVKNFSLAAEDGTYRAYSQAGEFLMLATVDSGIMSTLKSFFEV